MQKFSSKLVACVAGAEPYAAWEDLFEDKSRALGQDQVDSLTLINSKSLHGLDRRHSIKMAYATISVKNIASTANEDDVLRFFRERIPGSDPIVGPLIQDTNSPTKSTTITFKGKNKASCQKSIRGLSNSSQCDLSDSAGITSTLSFSGDFLGLTVLANNCAPDEDPYFE